MSHSVGKAKQQAGYIPHYPVVIIPGFASSGLVCQSGYAPWLNERIWLSVAKISSSMARKLQSNSHFFVDPEISSAPMFTSRVMYKRAGGKLKSWKKYTFYVSESNYTLYWFEKSSNLSHGTAAGCIHFDEETCIKPDDDAHHKKKGTAILVATKRMGTYIASKSAEEREQIIKELEAVVESYKQRKAALDAQTSRYMNQKSRIEVDTIVKDRLINQISSLEEDSDGNEDYLSRSTAELVAKAYKLSGHKLHIGKDYEANSASNLEDFELKNLWLQHLCLAADGKSDPIGVRIRPVEGLDACSYLDKGISLTRDASYVFGPLIDELEEAGYIKGHDLFAMPYDWRLPPFYLQQRDGYFSYVVESVTEIVRRTGRKTVFLCHSMGNRVMHYFLNWLDLSFPGYGRKWISDHIHTWLAVGAPFLGAPKTVRGVITGDKLGLDTFMNNNEGLIFGRSLGSIPWLFPNSKLFFVQQQIEFMKLRNEETGEKGPHHYHDLDLKEALEAAGASRLYQWYEDYYMNDPLFGGPAGFERVLQAPPIDRLYHIYGINLETEVFSFIKKDDETNVSPVVIDSSVHSHHSASTTADQKHQDFVIKDGIAYESASTAQPILEMLTGTEKRCSGDGTVPYASLAYCKLWDGVNGLQVRVREIQGGKHREILDDSLFTSVVLEFVMKKAAEEPAGADVIFSTASEQVNPALKDPSTPPSTFYSSHSYNLYMQQQQQSQKRTSSSGTMLGFVSSSPSSSRKADSNESVCGSSETVPISATVSTSALQTPSSPSLSPDKIHLSQ